MTSLIHNEVCNTCSSAREEEVRRDEKGGMGGGGEKGGKEGRRGVPLMTGLYKCASVEAREVQRSPASNCTVVGGRAKAEKRMHP